MLSRPYQAATALGLALAFGLSATTPSAAKTLRSQDPAAAHASVSGNSGNATVPGARPTSPDATNQQNCWIPSDDDKAYGYYGGCNAPRARQMR